MHGSGAPACGRGLAAGKTLMSGKCGKPGGTLLAEREGARVLTKFEPGLWH
jgi:hypothetical protein